MGDTVAARAIKSLSWSGDEMANLFLSYGTADAADFAARLAESLTARGHTVWRDRERLQGTRGWDSQIEIAIGDSDAMVAVLSPHATRRTGDGSGSMVDSVCLDEIAYARFGPKPVPIVPVMAVETTPPLLLIRQQYIDFLTAQTDETFGARLSELTDVIDSVVRTGAAQMLDEEADMFDLDTLIPRGKVVGRRWLHEKVDAWLAGPAPLLLITGDPGIGKSTFLADRIAKDPLIGAYHICRAVRPDTLEVGRAIRSMALMLARRTPAARTTFDRLSGSRGPLARGEAEANPQRAIEDGLWPLVEEAADGVTLVLAIDSLDEGEWGTGRTMAVTLADALALMPAGVRLVCTTRRDPSVMALFLGEATVVIDAHGVENREDVRSYIDTRLSHVSNIPNLLPDIARMAEGNFMVARLIADQIERKGVCDLGASPTSVGRVYALTFRRLFPQSAFFLPIRRTLSVMLAAQAELPLELASQVLEFENIALLRSTLDPIAPYVIRGNTLSFFHSTLHEWLSADEHPYSVDGKEGAVLLAEFVRDWSDDGAQLSTESKFYLTLYSWRHAATARQGVSLRLADALADWSFEQIREVTRMHHWPDTAQTLPNLDPYINYCIDNNDITALRSILRFLGRVAHLNWRDSGVFGIRDASAQPDLCANDDSEMEGARISAPHAAHAAEAIAVVGNISRRVLQRRDAKSDAGIMHLCLEAMSAHIRPLSTFAHLRGSLYGYSGMYEDIAWGVYTELRQLIGQYARANDRDVNSGENKNL
ncbi:toll/interleukin-1 receptor domain-containing protein [Acuticoccus sp. I52.16.1]|uniref:toll/interleukin-1 receptor domain-containing protein n=1 Tax=Acuticoccus sp. I52.16.1 TaxID=2928472 RepID=UPI001FD36A67|nr:toll/interleukin-1 receptor domain-containing protein [Acuticoccus sp. I52.16.1]UOM36735.1 toll/interleukin-1 receptor domain-containing protein [Acuticoccus sp. I52.16.1]